MWLNALRSGQIPVKRVAVRQGKIPVCGRVLVGFENHGSVDVILNLALPTVGGGVVALGALIVPFGGKLARAIVPILSSKSMFCTDDGPGGDGLFAVWADFEDDEHLAGLYHDPISVEFMNGQRLHLLHASAGGREYTR